MPLLGLHSAERYSPDAEAPRRSGLRPYSRVTLPTMAKTVVTTTEYTDDLDGGTAAGTVKFAYEGVSYEIDLSKANSKAFAKLLAPYLAAARPVRARRTHSTRRRTGAQSAPDSAVVREWASANGHPVSSRGRISSSVLSAYAARGK